jgi:hypothetical protein
VSDVTQSDPNTIEKLKLHVPGFTNSAQWGSLVIAEIPLLKFIDLSNLDKTTMLRIASSLYLLGLQNGQTWIMNLNFELNSKTVIDLFRDYVAPDRLNVFYTEYFGWYPIFKDISERGILAHLDKIEASVKLQRSRNNSGYLPHNERMIVFYYATHCTEEHPTVTVDPESEYYSYIVGRLKHRGVFHLTDEVDGKLYTVMTHYLGRVLTISGRARSLPGK